MSAETTTRFFRPPDAGGMRRNQRRLALQRVLAAVRTVGLLGTVALAAWWAWMQTRSGARFSIRTIHVEGAVHTPRAAIDLVTARYAGRNLFQVDLDRVRQDLGRFGWVRRVDLEKSIPDTLHIRITEREPVALLRTGDRLLYVDEDATPFAELSPAAGNDGLPVIVDAYGAELRRSIVLLGSLQRSAPEIYSRVSEVRPIPPRGFALFDRELKAFVYVNSNDAVSKWRSLYAILDAERRPAIEYADLRFAGRVVVKPSEINTGFPVAGIAVPSGDAGEGL